MSTIFNNIMHAIARYEARVNERPTCLYIGEAEYAAIKQAATAWAPFSPAHDHVDGRARVHGLKVYIVDAKSHLKVA